MSKLTIIPFQGFYHSIHDDNLDRAADSVLQDDRGDCVHDGLVMRLFDAVDWKQAHISYAKEYTKAWADKVGIAGVEFEELNSPREYNFTTDRIFVKIPDAEVRRIFSETPRQPLHEKAAEWFTSRSGFISFYSADTISWGPLDTWDHNQIGCLIAAYCKFKEFDEEHLVEDFNCNGDIDNWILNTPAAVRVSNLAYRIRRMRGEV